GKTRSPEEMGRELAARLPALTQNLSAAGAGAARPLDAETLCEMVRTAFDPAAAVAFDQARADGEPTGLNWTDVGPAGAEASWEHYRHDSGTSVSWTMTEAPRGNVQSSVLRRLLAPHPDIARKRVSLLYRPLDPARAAGAVGADGRAGPVRGATNRARLAR